MRSTNLTDVPHGVGHTERRRIFGHAGGVLWLTGLSASGKSTLAMGLERELHGRGYACYVLDGDNIRRGLNSDLGFSPDDRSENIRRIGEVAALFAEAGLICIAAFISPYQADRALARTVARRSSFHEIHVAADLGTCEARDLKGLYRKARAGELRDFTGIDAPYEPPISPELTVDTNVDGSEKSLQHALEYVERHFPMARASPGLSS